MKWKTSSTSMVVQRRATVSCPTSSIFQAKTRSEPRWTTPAIVVLNQPAGTELSLNSDVVFYGLLFVHSDTNSASVKGNGSIKIFGALVVEGDVEISGNITLVYDDTSASGDTHKLPSSARFGRVAGSWLDASTAF